MKLISSAAISRQYDIFASPIVTTELLPSAFGVHTKNVSSPLRSGEITNAAIPVFGKAETPPALWRRGVQPGGKNGSRFCSCHSPSMREARKYFGFTSWLFRAFRRVAEGVDPYHAPPARFIFPFSLRARKAGASRKPQGFCFILAYASASCAYSALHFFVLTGVSLGTCFVSRV